jgi:hypothetical protein
MVVALAGDYFGDIDLENLDKCSESISDGWDQDPEASINRFKRVAGDMMKATRETSECILDYLGRLNGEICWAVKSGEDPVQAYKKYSSAYDVFLSLCKPTFKYALLARCNWDHFGEVSISGLCLLLKYTFVVTLFTRTQSKHTKLVTLLPFAKL